MTNLLRTKSDKLRNILIDSETNLTGATQLLNKRADKGLADFIIDTNLLIQIKSMT